MPVVDINLGHRNYTLSCGAGEENQVKKLAAAVNERVQQVQQAAGEHTSDAVVLAMVTLMLQDEILDLKSRYAASGKLDNGSAGQHARSVEETDLAVAEAIDAIADYVEAIAARIETR